MPIFSNLRRGLSNFISPNSGLINAFNHAFYSFGNIFTSYDPDAPTYVKEGFNSNPDVYAIVMQMATKTSSVPFMVKDVEDKGAKAQRDRLIKATGNDLSLQQQIRLKLLNNKAFSDSERPFPMEKPNALQTWEEVWALYKVFIRVTGNCYFYLLSPEEGQNAGTPIQLYVLPAQFINIVLKPNANLLGIESPIQGYTLIDGAQFAEFPAEDVIHVKLPNPNFDINGSHLYGLSPIRSGLRNLETSNEALRLNLKTLKSGGAYGLIHGKTQPMTAAQAQEIKTRLKEMDMDTGRLAKLAGVSAEIGFTRLSLTAEELKPFDYLAYDQKILANVLGWDVILLNSDTANKFDNKKQAAKDVITNNIQPDLNLLSAAFNDQFLPRFKGFENSVLEFDVTELPEMQENIKEMSGWLYQGKDRGVFTGNEVRASLKFPESEDPGMEVLTVGMNVISLQEALTPEDFTNEPQDPETMEETE